MVDHFITGSINWDITIFLDKLPNEGEEVNISNLLEFPGGKGANIAISSRNILGKNKVALLGTLGTDSIGRMQIKILKEKGIVTDFILLNPSFNSGKAFVVIDKKGRNLIMTKKDSNRLAVVDESIFSEKRKSNILRNIRAITITDPPLQTVGKILLSETFDIERKITTWMPGLLSNFGLNRLKNLIESVKFLILNESESLQLMGSLDPVEACKNFIKKHKRTSLIITTGKKGCIYGKDDGSIFLIPTVNLLRTGLKIVNTAGSGDAFTGTFTSLKILGYDDIEAIRLSNLAGAIKATKKQIQASPDLDEILEFRKRYNVKLHEKMLLKI